MPRYAETIWCDDIRQELGNKVTLAGVLGDEIVVPQVPVVVQSFAIVQRWHAENTEIDRGVGEFHFELEDPGGERNRFPIPQPVPRKGVHSTNLMFVLRFAMFPFRLKGEYKFRTYLNGREVNTVSFYVVTPEDLPQ